jgi:hypothetical protein
MEIPDLVQQELGDEAVRAGVSLGDEDTVCFTPNRTLVYRGEGLLSDEKVDVFPHDFERLKLSEGRRKTKFTLFYTDTKREFGVPGDRAEAVLERLLEGSLQAIGAIDTEESVEGVFRFSELTLVVTEARLLKHLGSVTWDGDFESYPFEDVTGLDFEDGSVATAIVLAVNDRPERIKAPNEQAPKLRKTLQEALFAYHEVSSLADLNAKVASEPDEDAEEQDSLGLESGIDPLVGGGDEEADPEATQQSSSTSSTTTPEPTPTGESTVRETTDTSGDIEALEQQVAELTAAIEEQNERLEQQEATIKTLIKELRQGR